MPPVDWSDVWENFHALWGKSREGVYDKKAWVQLQKLLQKAELSSGRSVLGVPLSTGELPSKQT